MTEDVSGSSDTAAPSAATPASCLLAPSLRWMKKEMTVNKLVVVIVACSLGEHSGGHPVYDFMPEDEQQESGVNEFACLLLFFKSPVLVKYLKRVQNMLQI